MQSLVPGTNPPVTAGLVSPDHSPAPTWLLADEQSLLVAIVRDSTDLLPHQHELLLAGIFTAHLTSYPPERL